MWKNRQNNDHLMIVIPLTEGHPSRFLGKCDELAIFEVHKRNKQVLYESVHRAPPHEPGLLPSRLSELGVDVLMAGEMGPLAEKLLKQERIRVLMNVPRKAPAQTVRDYLNGELTTGDCLRDD